MTLPDLVSRGGGATLAVVLALAQSVPASLAPLRTTPVEQFTVNPGFRDWAPTTVAGTTILGGNSSNRGGLFAVDMVTGKVKWSTRALKPAPGGTYVATAPAVSGDIVIVPIGDTVFALSLATGKELWRGPATQRGAAVVASGGLAFVQGDDNSFHALDAKTGQERWTVAFARGGSCESTPVVRDGTVYVNGKVELAPATAIHPADRYWHLFALDANTGKERWRYPSKPTGTTGGVCLTQPVLTADAFVGVSAATLYAVDLATGRERWKPTEVRGIENGRQRPVALFGLVDAGRVLVGMTPAALMAFDKTSGEKAWEVAGQYQTRSPSTAVAGGVLYFQGHPGAAPVDEGQGYSRGRPVNQIVALPPGTLHALDLETRAILWTFKRPTGEPDWSFGFVTPVDGGLWVDSYQALVKLQ